MKRNGSRELEALYLESVLSPGKALRGTGEAGHTSLHFATSVGTFSTLKQAITELQRAGEPLEIERLWK
jgi:hypothetical protein